MIGAVFCGRKDLAMRKQRRFPAELKRQIVKEVLSGITSLTLRAFMSMWIYSGNMDFKSVCREEAILSTMPWWGAFSRPLSPKRSIFGSTKPCQMSKKGYRASSTRFRIKN